MPLASTISCKGLSQPQIAAKGIHLHFTLPPPFLNYEIFFYHVKCVLDKNHGFGVRQTKTTKAVCAAQNHTSLHKTTLCGCPTDKRLWLLLQGSRVHTERSCSGTVHDPCHPGYPTNTPLPSALSKPQANAVHTLPLAPLVLSAPNKEQELGVECPDLQRRAVPRRSLRLGVK